MGVASIWPTSFSTCGNTRVLIKSNIIGAADLSNVQGVTIGGQPCTGLVWKASGILECTPPKNLPAGAPTVDVASIGGTHDTCAVNILSPTRTKLYLSTATGTGPKHSYFGRTIPSSEHGAGTSTNTNATAFGADHALAEASYTTTGTMQSPSGTLTANTDLHALIRVASTPPFVDVRRIKAGTWRLGGCVYNGGVAANTLNIDHLCIYVWRPSTQTVVGYVYDSTGLAATSHPAGAPYVPSLSYGWCVYDFTGAEVTGVQDDDLLVVEFWETFNAGSYVSRNCGLAYGGTTETTNLADHGTTVTNGTGLYATVLLAPYDIYDATIPTLTGVTLNVGSSLGGESVTITGTKLTKATAVTFGGLAATDIVVVSDTTITCKTPAHVPSVVDVVVTVDGETFTLPNGYTYNKPATYNSDFAPPRRMPAATTWKSVDTSRLYPNTLSEIAEVAQTVNETVNSVLTVVASVNELLAKVTSINPAILALKAQLLTVRQALVELGAGHTGMHYLNVPVTRVDGPPALAKLPLLNVADRRSFTNMLGGGGNLGFFNTVAASLSDPGDIDRPQYGKDDYVAGVVVMVGSVNPLEALERINSFRRMLGAAGTNLDANLLTHPTGFKVVRAPQGNMLAWDAAFPVARLDRLITAVTIRQTVVYRSTKPFHAHTPLGVLKNYEIARFVHNPVKPLYLDTAADHDTEYYYAIGYVLDLIDVSGSHRTLEHPALSTVIRFKANPTVHTLFARGTPPDWIAVQSMFALLPRVQAALNELTAYIDMLLVSVTPNNALLQVAAALREAIAQKQRAIATILALLDELYHLFLPVGGVYAMSFYGKGGNAFFLRSLLDALNDKTDPNRPPFTTGRELTAGFILLGGAGSSAGLKGMQAVCDWFAGHSSTIYTDAGVKVSVNTMETAGAYPENLPNLCPNRDGDIA